MAGSRSSTAAGRRSGAPRWSSSSSRATAPCTRSIPATGSRSTGGCERSPAAAAAGSSPTPRCAGSRCACTSWARAPRRVSNYWSPKRQLKKDLRSPCVFHFSAASRYVQVLRCIACGMRPATSPASRFGFLSNAKRRTRFRCRFVDATRSKERRFAVRLGLFERTVFTYPAGKQVGDLKGFYSAAGEVSTAKAMFSLETTAKRSLRIRAWRNKANRLLPKRYRRCAGVCH